MLDGDELSPEVILAIQRVLDLKSDDNADPFDDISTDFTPVFLLNELFPDEASLAHTDAIQSRLRETHEELQNELNTLQNRLRQEQDPNRMHVIQEMISELLNQMSRIREKATESEAVVRNITKDIQILDLAKKNLILSMTTLKRLQMLVNALTQLEDLVKEKKYSDISETLAAVKQISASFKSYTSVPRIAQVWRRIQELQGEIRTMIDVDFDAFFVQDTSKQIKASLIADACLVVDVLGDDFRLHLIDRYVGLELKEYRRIFRTSDEAGQLDNISRRFAWFRRLLQTHEVEQGRVFPAEWRTGWRLLAKFAEITRDDIATLLSRAGKSLTVKVLLDNLHLTSEFEASMAKKWAKDFTEMITEASSGHSGTQLSISSVFEPHMGVFIDAQDRAISDMIAPHRKSKVTTKTRASLETNASGGSDREAQNAPETVVLPSSTELFYLYGQTLEQCAKLSTGRPLFDLCNVHKKWLKIYAEDVLIANLKKPPNQLSRKSMDSRFDLIDLQQASLILNTADYCQSTSLELETKIREGINPEFKEDVSLQIERDMFVSVISSAIAVQLHEFEAACDGAFVTMSRTSWITLNQVSGPSPYIGDLVKGAEQVIETMKPLVEQKRYLRNLFDKACSLILAKFTNSLVRSRPLREIGAEQLLIDLQVVKSFLSKMPGEAMVTASYLRALTKTTARLESLLKVIVTPVDPPEGFILNYTLLIGDASFSNFQKILDLKGTPKAEQNNLLDSFLTITSTREELESTSFLSSLDMDPPTLSQLGALTSPSMILGTDNLASLLSGLTSPPLSGPSTGSNSVVEGGISRQGGDQRVFSDFRRFVSFGLRRDSQAPS